jgi:hypothetical protein
MATKLLNAVRVQAEAARVRFLAAIDGEQAMATQAQLVEECVTANRDTEFGRAHGFSKVRNLDDYRRAVPIRHYDDLEPWINRVASGEDRVLTVEQPIKFWKTTGTTSTCKKIPVTPASAMRTSECFLALQGTLLHYHPEIGTRTDTMLVTHISPKPVKQFCGPHRVPWCSTTEAPIEIRAGREGFVAPWLLRFQSVVEDDSVRLYFLLCFAALHDLRNVTCLHPSRFQTIASTLNDNWPRLVEELRRGTVLGERVREPTPDRADQLERIATKSGTLRPIDVWPNLTFVASWSGTYIGRYRDMIENSFCKGFLPMPSISSEAFATMTIDTDPVGQPLNMRGGIFEFIPAEEKVDAGTPTLQFHELTEGCSYEVVLTTLGGLYRYAMADIFKVTEFLGRVPRLEYTGRRSVCDLTGEKLAEEQVDHVVRAGLAERGFAGAPFTVCGIQAVDSRARPKYVLVLETPECPPDDSARDLDMRFRAVNSRYELKRNFGDLQQLEIVSVAQGTFERYRQRLVQRGAPAGQVKDKLLHKDGASVLADLLELSERPVERSHGRH